MINPAQSSQCKTNLCVHVSALWSFSWRVKPGELWVTQKQCPSMRGKNGRILMSPPELNFWVLDRWNDVMRLCYVNRVYKKIHSHPLERWSFPGCPGSGAPVSRNVALLLKKTNPTDFSCCPLTKHFKVCVFESVPQSSQVTITHHLYKSDDLSLTLFCMMFHVFMAPQCDKKWLNGAVVSWSDHCFKLATWTIKWLLDWPLCWLMIAVRVFVTQA